MGSPLNMGPTHWIAWDSAVGLALRVVQGVLVGGMLNKMTRLQVVVGLAPWVGGALMACCG